MARDQPILVAQGTFAVGADDSVVLTSILGSCVATCLFDPVAGVGGMNHFLLPGADKESAGRKSYGLQLTTALLDTLETLGAQRGRMQAKLFGGGRIINGMVNIGALNASFAEDFLNTLRIPVVRKSVGGDCARRVRFWPTTGQAQQKLLDPILLSAGADQPGPLLPF